MKGIAGNYLLGLMPATALVVASTAHATIREAALEAKSHYGNLIQICDGVADDVEIQAAIDALPITGGCVFLSNGTYNITASISITKTAVTLSGQGYNTILKQGAACTIIDMDCASNDINLPVIEYMKIEGNKVSYANGHGIYCHRSAGAFQIFDLLVFDVGIFGMPEDALRVTQGHAFRIISCDLENSDGNGVYLGANATTFHFYSVFSAGNGLRGADIVGNGHSFESCPFSNNGGYGIYTTAQDISFGKCAISTNTLGGIYVDTGADRFSLTDSIVHSSDTTNCIEIAVATRVVISNNRFRVADVGVKVGAATQVLISSNIFRNHASWAIDNASLRAVIESNTIYNDIDTGGGISNTNGLSTVSNNVIQWSAAGKGDDDGILNSGTYCVISGNIVVNSPLIGINVAGTDCIISNNQISYSQQHGIYVNGHRCTVIGNEVLSSSMASANTSDDIQIASGKDNTRIVANTLRGLSSSRRGITVGSAACDNTIITENFFDGQVSAAIVDAGTGSRIYQNIGYVTRNSGTATITGAVTTVDVTHGLVATPTRVFVTALQTGQGDYAVTTKGAATFTITFVTQPGGSTWTFDWRAQVGEG